MARAHFVQSARKAVPSAGIEPGDSYYWWQFRNCPKSYSKTPPKASQLTRSEYLSTLYGIRERIDDLPASEDLPYLVEEIIGDLNELADDCESKRENMPEPLQESETGELLERRAEACRSAAEELEQIDLSEDWTPDSSHDDYTNDEPVNSDGQTEEQFWQAKLEEVQNVSVEEE